MRSQKKYESENIFLKNNKYRLCVVLVLFCFLFTACGGMEAARETEEVQMPTETKSVEVWEKNLDGWADDVYDYSIEHRIQWGSAVVENMQYVFYTTNTQLMQMDKKSGEKTVLSRWKEKDVSAVTLYCTEDSLYEIFNNEVYCIDLRDGGRNVICTEKILEREGYPAPSNEIWGITVHDGVIYLELSGFEIVAYDAKNQKVEGKVAVSAVSCGFLGDFLFYRKHRSSDAIHRVNLYTKEDVVVREGRDSYREVFVMNGNCYYQCGDKIYLYEESGQDVEIVVNVLEYISSSETVIYYRNSSGELWAYDVQNQKIMKSSISPDPDGAYYLKSGYVVFDRLFYHLSSEEGEGLFPSLDISEWNEETVLSTPTTFEDKIKISVKDDESAGYPHGNMGEYQRFICSDAEWLYVVQNKSDGSCRLIRLKKDGTDKKCIYENKRGKIFCLNAKNNWLVFQLSEGGKDNIKSRKHSICKIKSNGSEFEKLEEVWVNDLWLYKDRIYYSDYTKWDGRNIYSMDMNGEDEKTIFEKEDGIEFEVINDKIYVFYYQNSHEIISGCELYQMNLDGTEKEKLLDIAEAYPDTICLWEDSVYYINEEEQLCRIDKTL